MKRIILIALFLCACEQDVDNIYYRYQEETNNMALNPSTNTEYVGRIVPPDANYPYGSAQDETVLGADDGTPNTAKFRSDVWGFLQGLLLKASITPNGDPDAAEGQYRTALDTMPITLTQLSNGEMEIINVGTTYTQNTILNSVSSQLVLSRGNNATSEQLTTYIDKDGVVVWDADTAGDLKQSELGSAGIAFEGERHPTDETPAFNKSILDLSGVTSLAFTQRVDSNSNNLPSWKSDIAINTKIPNVCDILSINAVFDLSPTGDDIGSPVSYKKVVNGGFWELSVFTVDTPFDGTATGFAPRKDNMKLIIEFDGTNL